jgi:hypothetical protein
VLGRLSKFKGKTMKLSVRRSPLDEEDNEDDDEGDEDGSEGGGADDDGNDQVVRRDE